MADIDLDDFDLVFPGYTAADSKESVQLGRDLKAGKRTVLFYSPSAFDWEPLHRFTHLCDTFVFVDPRATSAGLAAAMQPLVGGQTIVGGALVTDQQPNLLPPGAKYTALSHVTGELSEMRDDSWTGVENLQERQGWGAVFKLKRRVGGVDRIIWLIYIAGNPLAAYRQLFIENGVAPKLLVISNPAHIEDAPQGYNQHIRNEWLRTFGWDGEFGQLLRDRNAALPNLISADDELAWPTNPYRYLIHGWLGQQDEIIYTTGAFGWVNPPTAVSAGQRHVTVTRKRVTPQSARATGAVVLSVNTIMRYGSDRWPQNTLIIRDDPVAPAPEEPPFIPLPNEAHMNFDGLPLLQALREVEQLCAERGITSVAIERLRGFEDEADDLAMWRQQDGQIKKLILHLDCPGHFIDFAKAADVID